MLNSFWRLLKSGTDIRGVACENEAGEAVNLTDDAVAAIANGFLVWLEGRAGKQAAALRLAIGHDSRISAERQEPGPRCFSVGSAVRPLCLWLCAAWTVTQPFR